MKNVDRLFLRALFAMDEAKAKRILTLLDSEQELDLTAEDGGPGSGNWGHKGRPGLVGGSGKGGGKHYRSAQNEVLGNVSKSGKNAGNKTGFTGSRHDWANGLSGDKGNRADKLIDKYAPKGGDGKKSATQVAEEKIVSSGTPREDKQAYLELKSEARLWDKRKDEYLKNLDEDERKAFDYLEGKGSTDAERMAAMSEAEANYYTDLKSKALEGPTSGSEMPDEVKKAINPLPPMHKALEPFVNADGTCGKTPSDYLKLGGLAEVAGFDPDYYTAAEKFRDGIYTAEDLNKMLPEVAANAHKDLNTAKNTSDFLHEVGEKAGYHVFDAREGKGLMKNLSEEQQDEMNRIMNAVFLDARISAKLTISDFKDWRTLDFETYLWDMAEKTPEGLQMLKNYNYLKDVALGSPLGLSEPPKPKVKTHEEKIAELKDISAKGSVTSEEVQTARKNSGIMKSSAVVDLNGIDSRCAKTFPDCYLKVMEEFPEMDTNFGNLISYNRWRSGVFADCEMHSGNIRINRKSERFFGDVDAVKATYERTVASEFHPPGTDWTSVMTHELGHAVAGYYDNKYRKQLGPLNSMASVVAQRTRDALKGRRIWYGSFEEMARDVSKYARKDRDEFWAECLAEYKHSASPREICVEAVKQFHSLVAELESGKSLMPDPKTFSWF